MIDHLPSVGDPTTTSVRTDTPGVLRRTVFVLMVIYLVMNHAIPDVMVLPIGFSLRPYEIVMMLILVAWAVWLVREPMPFPRGLVGAVGLGLVILLTLAPFLNAPGLSQFQSEGAQRGLVRLFLLAGLFLASYHLSSSLTHAKKLLAWVIGVSLFQGVLGIWEFVTETPLTFMYDLSRSLGLVFDPNAIRDELTDVVLRESGELRATTTAPHPIVLSAVIALAVLITITWIIYTKHARTKRWLILSAVILVLALPVPNSRTAFVMLAAAVIPFFILLVDELPKLVPLALVLLLALSASFIVSPQTPRLLLNSVTRADEDQNTQIRLERFERIPELLAPRPILGAGYLTHDPHIQIFDNAFNLGLIEFGILGLILTVWWFLCCLVRAWSASRWAQPDEKVLPVIGALTIIALLAGSAVFDAWTFDQYFPTCLVVLGASMGVSDVILRRRASERRQGVASRPTMTPEPGV